VCSSSSSSACANAVAEFLFAVFTMQYICILQYILGSTVCLSICQILGFYQYSWTDRTGSQLGEVWLIVHSVVTEFVLFQK